MGPESVFVTRERDDLGRLVVSTHWETDAEDVPYVTGPTSRDVDEAIAWARERLTAARRALCFRMPGSGVAACPRP